MNGDTDDRSTTHHDDTQIFGLDRATSTHDTKMAAHDSIRTPTSGHSDDRLASPPAATSTTDNWVRAVLANDTCAFMRLHAGLARALHFIALHFRESITFEQLVRETHVSASHLRFLFREILGASFKHFLQRVRIAQARRLMLEQSTRRVCEIALSVGFNDLSHFQKCFRMIVGQTPGDLRRACAQRNGIDMSGPQHRS